MTVRIEPDSLSITIIAKIMKKHRNTVANYLSNGQLKGQTIRELCDFYYEKGLEEGKKK